MATGTTPYYQPERKVERSSTYFDATPKVRTWAEFTGMMPLVVGRRMKDLLLEFTRTWYNRYAVECDRVAGASSMSEQDRQPTRSADR